MALFNSLNTKLHRFITEMYPQSRSQYYYAEVSQVNTADSDEDHSNEQSFLLDENEQESIKRTITRQRRSICSVETMQTIDEETETEKPQSSR
ncbi:hypothetical protein INT44_006355 [Umbelopsis vinacea]|uniref:Uncharacterized protein n=1 Tax=Umbelopsis vinacea TaxID=44442 RepID=A0A8H7PU43_9FUNG|nr:hypothetical protein INT44_006355 [Umbelopsis vinacea]